ncbi:MAG: TetR family transcriptional regulator C-terminal domain-containing protein [Clostridiales bacterium]|nr:TetR family transcriptional regulator C-terminal domain-containing protein [Clostridiales bacterium]
MATDRRTKYTKSVIRQALFELMKDRPINKITVTDICKTADINRSTFYSYYEDVYALLASIQNDLFEDVVFTLSTENWFEDLLKLVDENKDLCQVLLGPHGDASFIRQLIYLGYENSIKIWKGMYPNAAPDLLDYFYAYMSSGVIGVLENWVCSDYQLSTKEVGNILMGITMQGLSFLENTNKD